MSKAFGEMIALPTGGRQRLLQMLGSPELGITCLVALTVLKIAAFLCLWQVGVVRPFAGDNATAYYIPIAQRLLTEGRFNGPDSRDDSWVSIGYPALLAAAKWIAPQAYLTLAVVWQMVLDLGVALLLYALAAWTAGRATGFLAGMLWLVYPPAILTATWITAENPYTAVLVAALVLLVLSLQANRPGWSWVAGLVLGAATLIRGTTILYPLFLLPFLLLRREPGLWRKGLLFLAGAAMAIAPWTIRNRLVLHDNIAVSVGIGEVFRQGCDARSFTIDGKQAQFPLMNARAIAAGIVRQPIPQATAGDRWTFRIGLHEYSLRWRERPWSFVPFALHKLVRLFYGTESGNVKAQVFLGALAIGVLPLALWRMVGWRREFPYLFIVAGSVWLYFVLLHWITLPQYRYMHPVMPLMILAAADQVRAWLTPAARPDLARQRVPHPSAVAPVLRQAQQEAASSSRNLESRSSK